ncbi:MAG: tetratricopeptide repeat protein [Deltaproteobacteria bacterium]|nr:tetratricopeptide repeat protein [Deltaproteobacteria bacterium]
MPLFSSSARFLRPHTLGLCLLLASLPCLTACPTAIEGKSSSGTKIKANANGGPAEAMMALLVAARDNNVEQFKAGLSQNFILTIERLQELSVKKPKLKGAFEWDVFIRTMAKAQTVPTEELINGKKAEVKATDINGRPTKTNMMFEDDKWKLVIPGGMVRTLDNLDHFAEQMKGDAPQPEAKIKRGGGGDGGRVRGLAKDATEAQKAHASALDTFDMGDLPGAETQLKKALALQAENEELTVALGRVQVQLGKGKDALKTFEGFLKKHPDSSPTRHYLGMAYLMDNRPGDAAIAWREVAKRDASYGEKFKLTDRAEKAEGMKKAKNATPKKATQK